MISHREDILDRDTIGEVELITGRWSIVLIARSVRRTSKSVFSYLIKVRLKSKIYIVNIANGPNNDLVLSV